MLWRSEGAAGGVTGSKHVIETSRARILLDCGLFQGRRAESVQRNRTLGIDPREIDAVVLSHAHIDHSGALPRLVKLGYRGPIYCTPATRDLCQSMLTDAAMIQASDARYVNKLIDRDKIDMERVEPLYERDDVDQTISQMVPLVYHIKRKIAHGIELTFHDAGHVLGSALSALDIEDEAKKRRLLFSGDLGRTNAPILRDPEVVDGVQVLALESTYGDRKHAARSDMEAALAEVLTRVHKRGGKVLVPSFALERAQEVLYAIKTLRLQKRIPPIRVYVDSPLTVQITEVFRRHPECYDRGAGDMLAEGHSPFDFENLEYVSSVESSKAIDAHEGPCVIISASGMCEGGRVLHHLKSIVGSSKNAILIVGYQAQHTLGRRIVERRPRIRIFGVERKLSAEVEVLNGLSAHADVEELSAFARATDEAGALDTMILVHGEPNAQEALAERLEEEGRPRPFIAQPGKPISLSGPSEPPPTLPRVRVLGAG